MRFIIHELPYETPLAAGQFRYERDGRPAGVVEHWRLTTAVDGYRFLRVDVDGRGAAGGESTLYHLTLNPAGRPERLRFLHWDAAGRQVTGNVLFEESVVMLARDVNGERVEEEMMMAAGYSFWLPSAVGFGLLVEGVNGGIKPAVTLTAARDFVLEKAIVQRQKGSAEEIALMGKAVMTERVIVCWGERPYTLWLDEHEWPMQVEGEGWTAVEGRYVRYGDTDAARRSIAGLSNSAG